MRPENDPRPTVCINEAARLMGVSRRTIHHWLQRDWVESYRIASGSVRIVKASLWRQAPPR